MQCDFLPFLSFTLLAEKPEVNIKKNKLAVDMIVKFCMNLPVAGMCGLAPERHFLLTFVHYCYFAPFLPLWHRHFCHR